MFQSLLLLSLAHLISQPTSFIGLRVTNELAELTGIAGEIDIFQDSDV